MELFNPTGKALKQRDMKLIGLQGTLDEETTGLLIKEPNDVKVVLNNGFAATTAGNNGALNIWYDYDAQVYRCEFMKHYVVQEKFESDHLEEIVQWTERIMNIIN